MKAPLTKFLVSICLLITACLHAQYSNKDFDIISTNASPEATNDILFEAVKAVQLDSVLKNVGPFTVFAPSDAAFERFSGDRIKEWINAKDKSALKSLLSYHIVAGRLTASRILRAMCRGNGKASFTTIQGKKLTAHMDGYDIVLTDPVGNTARITSADRNLENGIIHQIDSVILPTQM